NQPPRLDRALFRVPLTPDDDPIILGPFGRVSVGVRPDDVREQLPQFLVTLELALDLPEKGFRRRTVEREDADRNFGITQDVADCQTEGDEAGLAMLASPQIQPAIRLALNLPTPLKQPVAIQVFPSQHHGQKVEQIVLRQLALDLALYAFPDGLGEYAMVKLYAGFTRRRQDHRLIGGRPRRFCIAPCLPIGGMGLCGNRLSSIGCATVRAGVFGSFGTIRRNAA